MPDPTITILHGDVLDALATLADASVDAVVTSPPYWGCRDYGVADQMGLEAMPDCLGWARGLPPCRRCFVCALRRVFADLARVLRPDGVCWLNLGDTFFGDSPPRRRAQERRSSTWDATLSRGSGGIRRSAARSFGLKAKDLCLLPARVALALQQDGWYVRAEVIWHKPVVQPESVRDRPTRSHEQVYLLTRQPHYQIAMAALSTPLAPSSLRRLHQPTFATQTGGARDYQHGQAGTSPSRSARRSVTHLHRRVLTGDRPSVNARTVWTIAVRPGYGHHPATMTADLADRLVRSAVPVGGVVLDPFGGSGTTGAAALAHGASAILIELAAESVALMQHRFADQSPVVRVVPARPDPVEPVIPPGGWVW